MDPVKRKIILKEIEHWRDSKLLPDHYCDFLRNLYIEQDASHSPQLRVRNGSKFSAKVLLYIAGVISFILLLLLYFTTFLPMMQTMLSVFLIGLLFWSGLRNRQKHPIAAFSALGAGCMLSIFLGIITLQMGNYNEPSASVILVAVCGLLWLGIGLASQIGLLQLCGYFALLLSYMWLIQTLHPNPGWLILQGYALPVSVIMYYLGKYFYRGISSAGAMLLISAGLYFVMPEGYGILFTEVSALVVQPVLAIKLGLVAYAIWSMRRRNRLPSVSNSE